MSDELSDYVSLSYMAQARNPAFALVVCAGIRLYGSRSPGRFWFRQPTIIRRMSYVMFIEQ